MSTAIPPSRWSSRPAQRDVPRPTTPPPPAAAVLPTGLADYTAVADATAGLVIRRYSTSFGLASRLLGADVRTHVANVYALVRVADEIVDGPAVQAGLTPDAAGALLDDLERETLGAIERGFSSNLVVHAFANTARWAGFGADLVSPFFASMRADLTQARHDDASFAEYVYGSAEVVGLMCLRAFLRDERDRTGRTPSPAIEARLVHGARRLGAAFQEVNFLRDLAADFATLGRSYFPGVAVDTFTEGDKHRLLDRVDAELADADAVIPLLPTNARRAVDLARALFAELSRRLRETPAEELARTRIRVPDAVKARIALQASMRRYVR